MLRLRNAMLTAVVFAVVCLGAVAALALLDHRQTSDLPGVAVDDALLSEIRGSSSSSARFRTCQPQDPPSPCTFSASCPNVPGSDPGICVHTETGCVNAPTPGAINQYCYDTDVEKFCYEARIPACVFINTTCHQASSGCVCIANNGAKKFWAGSRASC
jgi:hypothetical protein